MHSQAKLYLISPLLFLILWSSSTLILSSTAQPTPISTTARSDLYRSKWKPVFVDEFDGPTLNLSNWDIEVNCWGGGNNEKQCYTARPQNIFIQDGILNLKAIAETYRGSFMSRFPCFGHSRLSQSRHPFASCCYFRLASFAKTF
jgi:hypothetical protein